MSGLTSKLLRFHRQSATTLLAERPQHRQGAGRTMAPAVDLAAEQLAESFRTLRTHVLFRSRHGARSLMLASARPQEGKSTIAANLGVALASGGRRVLVVDGDLRRPSLHRLFGVPNRAGLSELLGGESTALAGVCQPVSAGLSVLTSGMLPKDPQVLLLSSALEAVVAAMERAFDIVIVDSPPVLTAADAALLAAQLDGVILVLRAGSVTVSEARLVRDRLTATGSTVIGCVMSHFAGRLADTYHPYSYNGTE